MVLSKKQIEPFLIKTIRFIANSRQVNFQSWFSIQCLVNF
jgi:hypothetical protein